MFVSALEVMHKLPNGDGWYQFVVRINAFFNCLRKASSDKPLSRMADGRQTVPCSGFVEINTISQIERVAIIISENQ